MVLLSCVQCFINLHSFCENKNRGEKGVLHFVVWLAGYFIRDSRHTTTGCFEKRDAFECRCSPWLIVRRHVDSLCFPGTYTLLFQLHFDSETGIEIAFWLLRWRSRGRSFQETKCSSTRKYPDFLLVMLLPNQSFRLSLLMQRQALIPVRWISNCSGM